MLPGRQAAPRANDNYYYGLGQRGHYRQSHTTADLIFKRYLDNCRDAKIYQGGYTRANGLQFLAEISTASWST